MSEPRSAPVEAASLSQLGVVVAVAKEMLAPQNRHIHTYRSSHQGQYGRHSLVGYRHSC